jgi:hypothetical protein
MKKIIRLSFLLLYFIIFQTSLFGQEQQINIQNNIGVTIKSAFITQTGSLSWGNDLFGNRNLPNGNSITIRLPNPMNASNTCDIKLIDSDGDSYIKWNYKINQNQKIEFTFFDISSKTETYHFVLKESIISDQNVLSKIKSIAESKHTKSNIVTIDCIDAKITMVENRFEFEASYYVEMKGSFLGVNKHTMYITVYGNVIGTVNTSNYLLRMYDRYNFKE